MNSAPKILLVDDNPDDRALVRRLIQRELPNSTFDEVRDSRTLYRALAEGGFDVVITDYQLHWTNGIRVTQEAQRLLPGTPVVMFTGNGSEEIAVEAMKAGLADYVLKSPQHRLRLPATIRAVIDATESGRRITRLESRLDGLLNRLDVGVFRLSRTGRLLDANQAFFRLLGLGGIGACRGLELHSLAARAEDKRTLDELLERQHGFRDRELPLRHADGTTIWVKLTETLVPDEVEDLIAGSLEDVTARKQAEHALAEASRTQSSYFANLSHEIRTPMNSVLGSADLLLETPLDTEQREYAEVIQSSGRALLTLINDVLDYSKFETGELELESTPFRARACIASSVRALAPRAHAKGLEIAWEFAPDVPDDVRGDPGRLRQVLTNLVANAIEFTQRGEVVVRVHAPATDPAPLAANQVLREHTHDTVLLHVVVEDTGSGIAPEKLPLLFTPFVRVDAPTARKFGGTGLGLAICARLVQQMGGRTWVESAVGTGSKFHFTVTLGRVGTARGAQVPPPSELCDRTVLVVDDNATSRRILVDVLRQWRMQPTIAEDGVTGLEILNRAAEGGDAYDLALVDIRMPRMGGFELAAHVRDASMRTALVMMTAAGIRGDAARCRELGVAGYVMKPIEASSLLGTLRAVLGGEQRGERALVTRHDVAEIVRPLRVLLVDDDAVHRMLAKRTFERAGHAAVEVASGQDAIDSLRSEGFDLVCMDVQMPQMDGFETTRRIRELERETMRRVPILAWSARTGADHEKRCLDSDMDGCLSKPIQAGALFALVQEILERTDET
ncbi:MAG: response regulator [Planctomycetota bacterium]